MAAARGVSRTLSDPHVRALSDPHVRALSDAGFRASDAGLRV